MSKAVKNGTLFLLVDNKLVDGSWGKKYQYLTYSTIALNNYKHVEFLEYSKLVVKESKKADTFSVTVITDDKVIALNSNELDANDGIIIFPNQLTIKLGTISHTKIKVIANSTRHDSIVNVTIEKYFGGKTNYINDLKFLADINNNIDIPSAVKILKDLYNKTHGKDKVKVTKELAADIASMMLLLGIDKKFLNRITLDCLTGIVNEVVAFKKATPNGTPLTNLLINAVYSCYRLSIIRTKAGSLELNISKWKDEAPYFQMMSVSSGWYYTVTHYLTADHISRLFSILKMKECFTQPVKSITIEQSIGKEVYKHLFVNKCYSDAYPTNKLFSIF